MTRPSVHESRPLAPPLVFGLGFVAILSTSLPVVYRTENPVVATSIMASPLESPALPVSVAAHIRAAPLGPIQVDPPAEPLGVELVRQLRAATGFTWEQLAKLLGVSRRSLHFWAAGGRMAAVNEEAVGRVLHEIGNLPGAGAAERRVMLLAMLNQARSARASSDVDINRPVPTYTGETGTGA